MTTAVQMTPGEAAVAAIALLQAIVDAGPGGGGGLPAGSATGAKQDTGNTSLATLVTQTDGVESSLTSIDGKLPALSGGRVPVVVLDSPDVTAGPTNITTQNLVPAGTATANSAVELTCAGRDSIAVQVTGTYTGALSLQGTVDGTTWVTLGGSVFTNIANSAIAATITSAAAGVFLANVGAYQKVRVTALAAVTGTAVVSLRAVDGNSQVVVDNGNLTTVTTVSTVSAVASITPGVAASNLGKAEDAAHASGDTGVAVWGVRNDNAASADFGANGDYTPFALDQKGVAFVRTAPAITGATVTNVASAASDTVLKASNAARRALIICNVSTSVLYVKYGTGASASSFTVQLPPTSATGPSVHVVDPSYTGAVNGFWASANGSAGVTEIA